MTNKLNKRFIPIAIVLAFGITSSIGMLIYLQGNEAKRVSTRFQNEAHDSVLAIKVNIQNHFLHLKSLGYEVRLNQESLYGDVFELAKIIGPELRDAAPGVYIRGGEPTIMLPDNPGRGGRNQSLSLALSEYLSGSDKISLLVAGTDGTDGPTSAAGGLVDGKTFADPEAAREALQKANAGAYLEQQASLFVTGPTNTNVMDLMIAIVE